MATKSEVIKNSIESNCKGILPGILAHSGTTCFYTEEGEEGKEGVVRSVRTSKMIIAAAEGVSDDSLKSFIAQARKIALEQLKMVSADILIIDPKFKKDHLRALNKMQSEDGRILGMTIKTVKEAGLLPLGADFTIVDPKDEANADDGTTSKDDKSKAGRIISDAFVTAMKKYFASDWSGSSSDSTGTSGTSSAADGKTTTSVFVDEMTKWLLSEKK